MEATFDDARLQAPAPSRQNGHIRLEGRLRAPELAVGYRNWTLLRSLSVARSLCRAMKIKKAGGDPDLPIASTISASTSVVKDRRQYPESRRFDQSA